jgi:peptidoglycan/xylan/chitin deacetylase (PgdA/CDA1 family)
MKRKLAASFIVKSGGCALLGKLLRWSGVLCLNYHRIGNGDDSLFDRELWSAGVDAFDRQVRLLKKNFDVVSPKDLAGLSKTARGRCIVITFDDGYLDNYVAAFPVLRTHGVGATFFVTTGFLDQRRLAWWDEIAWLVRRSTVASFDLKPWLAAPVVLDEPTRRCAIRTLLNVYKALPWDDTDGFLQGVRNALGSGPGGLEAVEDCWMTWDMVREMQGAGMTVGGHTVHHPVLARMPFDGQWAEVSGCARRIEQELGQPMRYFSYPVGGANAFNQDTRECLRRAGVEYAFSYYGGINRSEDWDDYDLRRVAVETYVDMDLFRTMVTFPQVFSRPR